MRQRLRLIFCLSVVVAAAGCEDAIGPDPAPATWRDVAAGYEHTCATASDDVLWCWGRTAMHRLGFEADVAPCLENGTACTAPVPVHGRRLLRDVTVGEAHGCGRFQQTAYCWGWDRFGQLGDAGQATQRCFTPGGLDPLPCSLEARSVALGFGVTDIDAGPSHSCAATTAGDLYCWGLNQFGQLGTGDRVDGDTPRRVLTPDGERIIEVAAALSHTCALAESGNAYCWGANPDGEFGDGTRIDSDVPVRVDSDRHFVTIDAAIGHVCAIDDEGTLFCWGFYGNGRLGGGTAETSRLLPYFIGLPEPVRQVTTGQTHSCAVAEDDSLYCWGGNAAGQLGIGVAPDQYRPVEVPFPEPVAEVSAGFAHTCAVARNGALYCWGANDWGQLGTGDQAGSSTPVRVGAPD
ncbi:MAG TPA: hypothetical protein VF039_07625 [Longimicrobiales bacterium]